MTSTSAERHVDISLLPKSEVPELGTLWRDLESRADASAFLGWTWIRCWLESLPSHIEVNVLCATRQGVLVGLAVIVIGRSRRLSIAPRRTAHLHSTGLPEFDGLAIEHNGFLLDRQHAASTSAALLGFLCDEKRGWDCVQLPGLTETQLPDRGRLPPSTAMRVHERQCPVLPLQPIRDRQGDFVGMLGAKRRAHLRRSLRACEAWGPLSVSVAQDVDSARDHLDCLLKLHRARRAFLKLPSAFDTDYALAFHRQLIRDAMPRGEVQLLRVRAGDHDIGYLYSLVHRGRVSFYQSGYDYARVDSRFSPGLVTLALGIQHNAALGLECFDFLAGDAAYKRALATHTERMGWIELQRDGLLLRTENALRHCWRKGRIGLRDAAWQTAGALGPVTVCLMQETAGVV